MTKQFKDRPPWTGWLRFGVFIAGIGALFCGVKLLLEWIDHPQTWVYPRSAFWGSLFMQWSGVVMLTMSTLGWSAYIGLLKKSGKLSSEQQKNAGAAAGEPNTIPPHSPAVPGQPADESSG